MFRVKYINVRVVQPFGTGNWVVSVKSNRKPLLWWKEAYTYESLFNSKITEVNPKISKIIDKFFWSDRHFHRYVKKIIQNYEYQCNKRDK